jgi:glycosyltransferase involved in cell wall biosynthesis
MEIVVIGDRSVRIEGLRKTIWLTRPDIRALCRDDPECFDYWLATTGLSEYRALEEEEFTLPEDMFTLPAVEAFPQVMPTPTKVMWLAWSTRADLQAHFDFSSPSAQQQFMWWVLSEGARQTPVLAKASLAVCTELMLSPGESALAGVEPKLTRFMELVWRMRPDVQAVYRLDSVEAQQDFVWWFFTRGVPEMGLSRYVTSDQKDLLNRPSNDLAIGETVPVTCFMKELWNARPDLAARFSLATPIGRAAYTAWFFAVGLAEMAAFDLLDEKQRAILLSPVKPGSIVPLILTMIRGTDLLLQERHPDPTDPALLDWARSPEARRAYPILAHLVPETPGAPIAIRASVRSAGVTLVGYANAQSGIGEDVRVAALALREAGVPVSIFNVEPGAGTCQDEHSADAFISMRNLHDITMFCTTGMETAQLAARQGKALLDGQRVVGYWPWELQHWPPEWAHAYDLVDEVWASSWHTYGAYAETCSKRVRHMPMAVTVEGSRGLGRPDFRLPGGRFLFVFSFDGLSSFTRKNPLDCLRAFKMAFPHGDEPVGLVVKAMRATGDNPYWGQVIKAAAEDHRIILVSGTIDRLALLDLYRACDCFLSLHRAEGFGRGIAEAMLLGKPVITTGYSGNLDFTLAGTAALVDYRLHPLGPTDYPFGEGQSWAQPDIDHAAWWMRRLVEDKVLRTRLAAAGQGLVAAAYSPSVVGETYARVLGFRG